MLMNIIGWLVIGAIAGVIAGMVMKGGGYGLVGDIIVGLVGALIGGFLAALLGLGGLNANDPISWGSLIIAVIGAIILIAILRMMSGNKARV
ncbi:MAG TPA: GlsB/YeaQ/YmgE family stress response membrane protein [Chloroflexia bacterium]|nr:GlsB/YeaQ/YmgE family stress response membrane protein [Chloroflexia bacterium]